MIARKDKPAVRLQLVTQDALPPRVPGAWKGKFELPDSFFDPLPEEELCAWEGD